MKRIFITQRSIYDKSRQELVECLDSKFSKFFGNDFYLIPVPNNTPNPQKFAEDFKCSGIILSGGNSIIETDENYSKSRHKCEKELLSYAIRTNIPVVGICYGMQFLNMYCGGNLCEFGQHVKTEHMLKIDDLNFTVNSYHQYAIFTDFLAEPLVAIGFCDDGTIEAFIHESLPWLGIMWHPERSTHKQKLWVEMIKEIFMGNLSVTKADIVGFLKKNYESY